MCQFREQYNYYQQSSELNNRMHTYKKSPPASPVTIKVDLTKHRQSIFHNKLTSDKNTNSVDKRSLASYENKQEIRNTHNSLVQIVIPIQITNTQYPVECVVNLKQNINGIMTSLIKNHKELVTSNQKLVKHFILTRIHDQTQKTNQETIQYSKLYRQEKRMTQKAQQHQKESLELVSQLDLLAFKKIFDRIDMHSKGKIDFETYSDLIKELPAEDVLHQLCLTLLHRKQASNFQDFIFLILTEPYWLQIIIEISKIINPIQIL